MPHKMVFSCADGEACDPPRKQQGDVPKSSLRRLFRASARTLPDALVIYQQTVLILLYARVSETTHCVCLVHAIPCCFLDFAVAVELHGVCHSSAQLFIGALCSMSVTARLRTSLGHARPRNGCAGAWLAVQGYLHPRRRSTVSPLVCWPCWWSKSRGSEGMINK